MILKILAGDSIPKPVRQTKARMKRHPQGRSIDAESENVRDMRTNCSLILTLILKLGQHLWSK